MEKSRAKSAEQIFIDPDSTLPKTYFELIQKVGSAGKYQKNMFFIFALVFLVTGSILLSTSFLFMNKQYACQQLGLLVKGCRKTICQIDDQQQRLSYFIDNEEQIQSVGTDYGPFMCDDELLLDMIRTCPYFGSLLGFIVFSFISDNLGRKITMSVSLGLATLGSIMVVLGFNLPMISIGVIMSGAGINVASAMTFCYLGEIVQNYKRQKYSILVQMSYTFGAMILTGLYYALGNWRIVSVIIQLIPVALTFVVFVFYAEETPMFLLKGSNKEALRALNRIGYINYGMKDILGEEDIQNVKREQLASEKFNKVKVNPLDLFKFRSLRNTTICSCLLGYVVLSMYYGPALIIASIGFNTYVSNIAIQISQLVGYIPCYYYIDKVKRRSTGFWLFLVTVICSLILTFVQKPQNCDMCYQSIVEVVVIFFFRFSIGTQFVMFLVYIVELFPVRIVGMGVSAVNTAGTIASTLCPLILGALERIEFNLMLFFFILGVIGCTLTLLLQQTHGKALKGEIQEIQFAKNKRKTQYISSVKSEQLLGSNKNI